MSERRSAADLGPQLEATLSSFPFPERDWESDARAVEARLTGSVRGSTDALLLAAPLPSEPGEPTAPSGAATALSSSGVRTQSLAEMARRSVEQKRAAERAMARESLALAAQSRPSTEQAAALREAVSSVRVIEAPPAEPGARAAQAERAPLTARGAPSAGPKLALGTGGLLLAAAALLWLRRPTPEPLASSVVPPVAALAKAESPVAAPVSAPGRAAVGAPAAPAAIDPSTLSPEGAEPSADVKRSKLAGAGPSAAPAARAAAAAGPSPEKVVLEEDQARASAKPSDRPAEKGLPPDPALRPADSTGGAIPVKPSTGAVQAALGAVMSGARHCVAGDEAASSAVVVFASDGHVQSVTVGGPAAGKPSGTCIEAQLGRARVQPFAAASFSVNASVRPD